MKTTDLLSIEGGHPLRGRFIPSGNKNSAFPVIAASLMCQNHQVQIGRVPQIGDVRTVLSALDTIGVETELSEEHLIICPSGISIDASSKFGEAMGGVRTAILFAPALLARRKEPVFIPHPGGDRIGSRPLDEHFRVLREMGVEVYEELERYVLVPEKLKPANIWLSEPSVTATELAILMAASVKGMTRISNYAHEPHVQDLCLFLGNCGVEICDDIPGSLMIKSQGSLRYSAEYPFVLGYDFMELGSTVAAVALSGGEVEIAGWNTDPILTARLYQGFGVSIQVDYSGGLMTVSSDPSKLKVRKGHCRIKPGPWPSLNTDLIPPALAVAARSEGITHVHEWMFEGRLHWLEQLRHMGADIELLSRHEATIRGVPVLRAPKDTIESPDIRAGMALLVAALGAEGTTVITASQIDRGYDSIDIRLSELGARIKRVSLNVG